MHQKIQTKTTMRYYHRHIQMPEINKTDSSKCWPECEEIGTFIHGRWECKKVQLLWKTSLAAFIKLNINLPLLA